MTRRPRSIRRTGISGIAVSGVIFGGWLVFAAIRDIDPVGGLRDILSGTVPASRTPGGPTPSGSKVATDPVEKGPTDPAPMSQTVVVGGIRVHNTIAGNVQRLLTAAKLAGFTNIGGGGWRSSASQRALRLLHGYTSDDQPSGHGGKLPVARPGTSRHERGLAIDFTNGGKSLTKTDPFFKWLVQYAATYGLRNLPSEPWHWSTDGH